MRYATAMIIALAVVGGWRPAVAWAADPSACPLVGAPDVQVEMTLAPPGEDDTRASTQLQVIPGRSPGPPGAESGQVVGLTAAEHGQRWQITARYVSQPDGSVCAGIVHVAATFGLVKLTVFVARELPAGSCIYDEVRRHELKHVAVDEALTREFAPELRQRLVAAVAAIGPVRARSNEQATVMLRRPIDEVFKVLMADLVRERNRRQAQIDTLEEYQRVSRSCDGEMARYVKKLGHL